jgi:radical SAM-linked protein
MRTIQRAIRRAELPAEYSQGFNPHMSLSLAQPLSVGLYSEGEYLDVVFTEEVSEDKVKRDLQENCPIGIQVFDVIRIVEEEKDGKKVPQCMALVEAAEYDIIIKYSNIVQLKEELESLKEKADWSILKKSKSGEKIVNIKPMIKHFRYSISEGILCINTIVSCGSRENLSPELLSNFIKNNTANVMNEAFVDIKRKEMYVYNKNKLLPIKEYLKKD